MPQPKAYNRETDFTERDGDDTDHAAINREFDGAAQSINEIRDNLALIQRDDGALANGIVGADQLAPSAFDSVAAQLAGATAVATGAANNATIAASTAISARDVTVVARDETLTAKNAAQLNAQAAFNSAVAADAAAAQATINGATAATAAIRDIYYGALPSDPSLDPNGNAVETGDLYYNTASSNTRVYSGSAWIDVAQGTSTPFQTLTGTGLQTGFTLSGTPGSLGSLEVFISGVRQAPLDDYTLVGASLEFTTAPPAGTANIFVRWISTQPINVPAAGSVGEPQLSPSLNQAIAPALALANTFTTVPTTNQGPMVVVTLPHLRFMVWNGTKYVRAPWHRPGRIFYTHHNNASEPGALPVRGDVSYNKADYPDLCEALGITGTGTFTLLEIRGEFLRVLDNGRGVDVGRVYGSAQTDEFKAHNHAVPLIDAGSGDTRTNITSGTQWWVRNNLVTASTGGTETRPRNIPFPAWVTY